MFILMELWEKSEGHFIFQEGQLTPKNPHPDPTGSDTSQELLTNVKHVSDHTAHRTGA